jgi:hypothetical protein
MSHLPLIFVPQVPKVFLVWLLEFSHVYSVPQQTPYATKAFTELAALL